MSVNIEYVSLYVNDKHLVSIPEWKIENGIMYGLCGDTGSGKSTIGKWIANVDPVYWKIARKNPPPGETAKPYLAYDNQTDASHSDPPLYLLQDAYQIFNPFISIQTHFKDVWINQSQPRIEHFEDIYTILIEIGISAPRTLMKRKVDQISQGEAQRMAFVLGLLRPASLMVYDEVFSNVDAEASQAMLSYLRKYCRDTNTPVIVISHDTSTITDFTDVVYQISEGYLKRMDPLPDLSSDHKAPIVYPPLIDIRRLIVKSFQFYKKVNEILCQLPEFSIGRSENVGLYGESGVGKTTLLRGLLGEHPLDWKEIKVSGNMTGQTTTTLADLDIRYLPQSVASAFNPSYPLNISLSEILNVHQQEGQKLSRLIEKFGLYLNDLEKYPDELSGGEIQRIGIISVLLGQPNLILLDESFSSVDHETRKSIWSVLCEEQRKNSFALLVVSHDVNWLRENMNRVYKL